MLLRIFSSIILFIVFFSASVSQDIIPKLSTATTKATKLFTPEDLLTCKRISDPQISPDGKWVLYKNGNTKLEDNKTYNDIYAISIDGTKRKNIAIHQKSDYNGIWSPDGKQVAFISTRSGKAQIYVQNFPDGKPQKITSMPNGVSNLAWSPDGKYFSFTSEVKMFQSPAEKYPHLPKAKVKIYNTIPIRHWDEWVDLNVSHLFIVPVNGGDPKDLMEGEKFDTPLKPFGGGEQIAWSPDSEEIAYTSKKVEDFAESTNSDIYIYNFASGKTQNITNGMNGFDKDPLYSPDGKWIVFHSQERAGFESDRIRLMLYNRSSGEISELSKTLDQWVQENVWAPDSKSLYLVAGDKGTVQIYNIRISDGTWKKVTKGWYNHGSGLDLSPDGKTLVFGRQNILRPLELYKMSVSGDSVYQLTHSNDNKFKKIKDATVKERWIESTDGEKVHCWVVYPPDFDLSKKYPLMTYCQGGPQNTITQRFHYRWNWFLMASNGYVVLLPNRRGLPGFGQDWNDAISLDWGGQPMQDILAATDEMAEEPYIDKNRMCAVGASAGGYATYWLAGNHEKRFKAFVSHSGVFNLESMYGSTEELWFPNWEYGGPYWESKNEDNYNENSPHRFAQNWDTPIMISTGGYDFRVPYTQSLEAYTVAQVKGIPSKFVIFPEQSHLILSLQEAVLWYHEFFEFLDKYCKNLK